MNSPTDGKRPRRGWVSISIDFIRKSFLEPVFFLYALSGSFAWVSLAQLFQDKVCLQVFDQPAEYCKYLSTEKDSILKDNILASVSQWSTYKEYMVLVPGALSALFIGSWCDNYENGKRYCLLATIAAQMIQLAFFLANAIFMDASVFLLVVSYLPPAFFGQGWGFFTCLLSFIATHVDNSQKGTRMILLGLVGTVGDTVGRYLAGVVIAKRPMFSDKQLQNYAGNFAISLIICFITLCWAFFFIKTKKRAPPSTSVCNESEESLEASTSYGSNVESEAESRKTHPPADDSKAKPSVRQRHNVNEKDDEKIPILKSQKERTSIWQTLKEIMSYKNLSGVWTTCTKQRPGNLRMRIWFMIIALNVSVLPAFGGEIINYSLIQKLYRWNSVMYSNLQTIAGIFHIFAMLIFIPVIFKVVKANDCQTAMISCILGILGCIGIGSIISPWGWYFNAFITSFSVGITSGIRTYLSKVLAKTEVSQVFAVTILIEAVLKCFGAVLFANLLKLTIHFYPTFVFHFMTFLLIISMSMIAVVDVKTVYPIISP